VSPVQHSSSSSSIVLQVSLHPTSALACVDSVRSSRWHECGGAMPSHLFAAGWRVQQSGPAASQHLSPVIYGSCTMCGVLFEAVGCGVLWCGTRRVRACVEPLTGGPSGPCSALGA
jgi:hypothetical protein